MSPIKNRKQFALNTVRELYPNLPKEKMDKVVRIFDINFEGNLSPVKDEQDSTGATGAGVSGREFVVYLGRIQTDDQPVGFNREQIGTILVRCHSF